jgi:methionyl-tRNA formyltransferase
VPISPEDTSGTLFKKLEKEASLGLQNFLEIFSKTSGDLTYTPQDNNKASFAPTILKSDGLINPFKEDCQTIINKLRAYSPWPGLHIFLSDARLKVHVVEAFPKNLQPGEIDTELGSLLLGTTKGTIRLGSIQPEGKKAQRDVDFLNGIKSKKISLKLNKERYE